MSGKNNLEFKGTKGDLDLKFVGPICIGIGTSQAIPGGGTYSVVTANTILPDTDEEYEEHKEEIEANMRLYAASPKLLRELQHCVRALEAVASYGATKPIIDRAKKLIEETIG